MNRKARRAKKRPGETYADVLARKQMLKQAVREAARDTSIQLEAEKMHKEDLL